MASYEKELKFAVETVKKAGQSFKEAGTVSEKSKFDLVTERDLKIEEFIKAAIKESFPEDSILAEETMSRTALAGRTWTVDPIDGTVNMAKGLPLYGVQCALLIDSEPVVGVIYLPIVDMLFCASCGGGAYRDGERLSVSDCEPRKASVSFGDFSHARPDDFTDQHRMVYLLSTQVAKLRMLGTAAWDFAALASGWIDATVLFTRNQWDLAPGRLIASEAGAVVCDLDGGEYSPSSRGIIAACDKDMAKLISECF